jgi:small subunit ribosomal protein S2
MINTDTYKNLSKRERLQITRERLKLEKNLGSISDLNRLPSAIFIVDINKERIAVAEAKKLNIPTFAIVDTNSDPNLVDFPIPANDDASKAISLITSILVNAIEEGLVERKLERDKRILEEEKEKEKIIKIQTESKTAEEPESDKKAPETKPAKIKDEVKEDSTKRVGKRPRKIISKKDTVK